MISDDTKFKPRQLRAMVLLADGQAPGVVAKQLNYSHGHISKLQKDPDFRAGLRSLRAQAEIRLTERLPALVENAMDELLIGLKANNFERRQQATRDCLKYLIAPLWRELLKQHPEMGGTLIESIKSGLDVKDNAKANASPNDISTSATTSFFNNLEGGN